MTVLFIWRSAHETWWRWAVSQAEKYWIQSHSKNFLKCYCLNRVLEPNPWRGYRGITKSLLNGWGNVGRKMFVVKFLFVISFSASWIKFVSDRTLQDLRLKTLRKCCDFLILEGQLFEPKVTCFDLICLKSQGFLAEQREILNMKQTFVNGGFRLVIFI